MRKKELFDGALALMVQIAFGLCLAGACMLLNDNARGWIFEGIALLIAVPAVIFMNREEKA